MRRIDPPPSPAEGYRQLEAMLQSNAALTPLLPLLPEGSTLDDARRLRERILQSARRPCSFLDRALGIERGDRR